MKILQFVEGGPRYGAAVSIRNLVSGLVELGVDVRFAAYRGRPMAEEMRAAGIPVTEIDARSKLDPRAIRQLRELVASQGIQVLHTHLSSATINGAMAGRISRVPVVSTVHGMNRKWTYGFSSHIIAVSQAVKRHLVGQGVAPEKISVVYNGIPMPALSDLPSPAEAKAALGIPRSAPVYGTVSRAHLNKGIQFALRAMPAILRAQPEARYVFLGDGKHLAELKTEASSLGLGERAIFLGFRDQVYPVLRAMDIFVFPSLMEAMGISAVEAMAAGVPVVASDVGGIPEVIGDGLGVLVPAGNTDRIAEECVRLFADAELRSGLAHAARESALDRFTTRKSAEGVLAVYELLARRALASGTASARAEARRS